MQSQQKRVKWSRGETAEALEERTDTGITQASVELMENCIPDIYGNISRRPALKPLERDEDITSDTDKAYFIYDPDMQVIPFYITDDDYILIAIHGNMHITESIRIKNKKVVYSYRLTERITNAFYEDFVNGTTSHHPLSFAQQNNYLLIASETKIYKIQLSGYLTSNHYSLSISSWNFIGGWYAPNGSSSKKVSNSTQVVVSGATVTLTDLEFNHDGNGFSVYIATQTDGVSTAYSSITTNLTSSTTNNSAINIAIPVGSIVQFPNIGTYMRVEGYWDQGGKIGMWGALLTPVSAESEKDKQVVVEYGYTKLYPVNLSGMSPTTFFPHPTQLLFLDQRLWAGDWLYGQTLESQGYYSLVIGSQIAKYNDFKNDYNQENEAITLDILTQYKEKIVHLVDYNGLKIMTDAFEYSYENGAVIKQSGNGSYRDCKPIVFESLCLYIDSTGNQVKAMQYEFQADIFNSSTVNSVAPHDLVWYPYCMAGYEDKVNSTGKYIFLTNKDEEGHPRIAVCNFVPGNQANIWSRWQVAATVYTSYIENEHTSPTTIITNVKTPIVQGIVNLKNDVIFLMTVRMQNVLTNQEEDYFSAVIPARLDFDDEADLQGQIEATNTGKYYYNINHWYTPVGESTTYRPTIGNATVAVYYENNFLCLTTTDAIGQIHEDFSQYDFTKLTVGIPINSIIRSHPIDVGGKTKSVMKRIGKAQMSVHGTAAGAITINGKTGYMNPRTDHICFYGVTGMKDEIKYTITNKNGAMFHLESLLMNIEYGTLDS